MKSFPTLRLREVIRRLPGMRAFGSTSVRKAPLVELREYELHPAHAAAFLHATTKAGALRQSLAPQLRLFSFPETGGRLHTATHMYYYGGGHTERDTTRQTMAQNPDWKVYVASTRPYIQTQSSTLWVEAVSVLEENKNQMYGLSEVPPPNGEVASSNGNNNKCILEFRRYRLQLGYDTVPRFLNLYGSGLPSKLAAPGTDPTTSLITVMYTEVGCLNEVIEIWRHGNGSTAMEASRRAAREATQWRSSIASIADLAIEFTSTIHTPTEFSPIR